MNSLYNEYLVELIREMFYQACSTDKGYNHQHISAYEEAQRLLIREGLIDINTCVYKDQHDKTRIHG